MSQVDLDGCHIVLLSEPPYRNWNNVLAKGFGEYDGQIFIIRDEISGIPLVIDTQKLNDAMPITGRIADWYSGSEYYIVV